VKRRLRRSAGFLAGVAVLGVVAGIGFRGASEDPLASLPREDAPVLSDIRTEERAERLSRHVTLSDARLGSIGFTISLPDPLPSGKLPLVVVLGGLGTGANNIRYIDAAGDNAIIGYDWPLPSPLPKGVQALIDIPALRAQALSVPGQVGAMLSWLSMQPWSDPRRISILGFSLGAIAAPAAERAARREGAEVRWTVLAYGGVGLDTLIGGNPRIKPAWIRPLLGAGIELLLGPLEPTEHLPHLTGHFLILTASGDTIIDPRASAGLEQLTPQPKTVVRTSGDHIGTDRDRQRLLQEAMTATRRWLISQGAVNALEP
jgi:dienelactone hydrolase